MAKRTVVRWIVLGTALAALGLHALWPDGHDVHSTAGAALVPLPGGRGFRIGSLAFAACELDQRHSAATTAAFCAPFSVPENRARPGGRRIDLHLALIRSRAAVAERDPVVLLAGGPGQAATASWPQVQGAFAPLLEHRNVLLLDQRGTGGSHALACSRDPTDFETASTDVVDLEEVRSRTRACLAEIAGTADPAQYTTSVALEDLEAVRQALGAPQFDLVGVSYGTRVAQQYARRHPDAVRSMVLDSAVPNELVLGSEFAQALDESLKAQFALCTHTPACAAAFGDPYANLYRLRDELRAHAPTVEYRSPRSYLEQTRTLDASKLASVVRLFAYSAETAALLPLAIARAQEHDYAPLLGQADLLAESVEDLGGNGMQLSVICAEDIDLLADRPQDARLLLGDVLGPVWRAQCEVWPHGARPADFHVPFAGTMPVLILSGEFDPVTPPRYAEAIARNLPNARVLVASGQGHAVMGRGCLPRLAARFVDTLDAKALDAGCIADFGPTPAFTGFNGASP